MTSSRILSWISSGWTSSSSPVCEETTTVLISFGSPPSYSTVTWLFPSGRIHGRVRSLRFSARRLVSAWASEIGSGISSSVSSQA